MALEVMVSLANSQMGLLHEVENSDTQYIFILLFTRNFKPKYYLENKYLFLFKYFYI